MSVSSFSWETIEAGPSEAVIDFHSPTVSNRKRHQLTASINALTPGELLYHIHSGKTAFSIFMSVRSRRMGVRIAYSNRDIKAVDPAEGTILDGFIVRHNELGKRRYYRVREGKERPVRTASVPKLPKDHYWIWKTSAGD